ncbi:Predicted transcriptional regulator, ArsR family [Oceanobacillus limi]|uniref:Predicted transcriptional regulator, ArsR family n=1 Tax=Oceanobacillus limi TaxID=930131 RepID=A0A1H9ZPC5_9BACI|nr:helix-turn-helix domain-containing protein [Oceanobacillus limi]SES83536.1 Predicted transcriptional regulator, ArsR family [Oceanobacillus limi]
MDKTLKVTNVLSDPTRFKIYEHIIEQQKEFTVSEISNQFEIHPNVARLHLTKLEDINLLISYPQKTGKGGRPSRLYRLSDEVIELNFPHRDYRMLSSIALEAFIELGEPGKQALFQTGKKYGTKVIENYPANSSHTLTVEQKIQILEGAGVVSGMYPKFSHNTKNNSISFEVNNCPFKEVVSKDQPMVCKMHQSFLKGMFEALFQDIELIETENMFLGCNHCSYVAKLTNI